MTSLAIKNLLAHRRRFIGTFLASFLGVAFLAGTLVLGDTLKRNFDSLFTDVFAGTDAVVRGSTAISASRSLDRRSPVPESVVATVARVDGVAAAVPERSGFGTLLGSDGRVVGGNGPPRLASSWVTDARLNPYRIVEGRAPVATPTAPSPKPGAARPQTVTKGTAGAGGAANGDDALRDREATNQPDPEAQWAREQHVRVSTAVKQNNCKEAASLALQLSNRAPAYNQQNVENDRSLKQCVPYINAEREKEAERQQRARALQKRNADEAKRPAAPTQNSK